ncbi:MAG: RNA polymerase-associated protein RapA [Geothrix sp.]|nr:RNA polymerase-associated protein RapA [Geothrix sp.]
MAIHFHPGQRWVSEGEPELGLGEVRGISARTVTLSFGASGEVREYALEGAPLRRVAFRAGDAIRNAEEAALTVRAVVERGGLLHYDCGHLQLCETGLSHTLSFSSPRERFFAGRFDPPTVFDLRLSALKHQHRRRKSEVRGFLGGRMDLLPHQLSIASEVTGRILPRVLLADEVGLGKTIEACLILHRLLLTGRARRVLILVPESLVHQWFLELLRRFNLWFHIYDEARCRALEEAHPGANPFLDDQLLLCDLSLFTGQAPRLRQALDAGWDLLVVDEAHHLGWSPGAASPEYTVVEALGHRAPGLLLLTATPEQLGMTSHFARLRLLDPDRFYDLDTFTRETEGYREVARLAEKLLEAHPLSANELGKLAHILGEAEAEVRARLAEMAQGDDGIRKAWIDALLDLHGTGRVMFRNTRETVAGFPKRVAHLHPLEVPPEDPGRYQALAREWVADADPDAGTGFRPDVMKDPRMDWLAALLRSLGQEKVLLICHTQRKAEAIETALKQRLTVKMAVFHEGLSLVQRDRGAAWFADANGARLLICSEIGSEGRNFQFAHHLVLFDLPLDPALLEQRMGRLDRIGQSAEIQVHVPFVLGSHQEVLARWYQAGLNAFAENLPGGRELLERFEPRLRQLAGHFHENLETSRIELERLTEAAGVAREEVAGRLEQGRDRLLEWNSFRPEVSSRLIHEIRRQDDHRALDDFMLSVLDHFFIGVEEVAPRTYQLGSAGVLVDAFPGLTSEGLTITCDRQRALAREDLQFLTWDHPLVTGALDLLLGSEQGNSSFARWPDAKASGLYLEAIYMLECIAPPHFHLDRFLPPTPLRVLVDHRGRDAGEAIPHQDLARLLKGGEGHAWLARPDMREAMLPRLIEQTRLLANHLVGAIVAQARLDMSARLEHEIARLRDLQKVNRSVRDEEIGLLVQQQCAMDQHIGAARLRLDALRLIHRGAPRG